MKPMYKPKFDTKPYFRYRSASGRFTMTCALRGEHLTMTTQKPLRDAPALIRKTLQHVNAMSA